MEKANYLSSLAEYFYGCRVENFDEETLHQVRRCLLDYLGCAVFPAGFGLCEPMVQQIMSLAPGSSENAAVWGEAVSTPGWVAAFANATRTSNVELDDCSAIGASVHPGVYIWSAILAQAQVQTVSGADAIRAAVFGYDLCLRLGLLATAQMRSFGLHGPGFIGALGVAGAVALLKGLNPEKIENALCIAASLLPVCPFSSFMEGSDAKDLYGGWGVALGMFAAGAAEKGLTGPKHILEGEKSLSRFFAGGKGLDVLPGTHYYIHDISFKQFSACHSLHPAITAVKQLLARESFSTEEIVSVTIRTYPYSYALNAGVTEPLSPSSARLCLPYGVAVTLLEGDLPPTAFLPERICDPKIDALRAKMQVACKDAYGDGPFSIRGCEIEIRLKDGRTLFEEATACQWDHAPSDEALAQKFRGLCKGILPESRMEQLERLALSFSEDSDLRQLTQILEKIGKDGKE